MDISVSFQGAFTRRLIFGICVILESLEQEALIKPAGKRDN